MEIVTLIASIATLFLAAVILLRKSGADREAQKVQDLFNQGRSETADTFKEGILRALREDCRVFRQGCARGSPTG